MTKILLAEDNPADVYLLREALSLRRRRDSAVVMSDGEQALELCHASRAVSERADPGPGRT